MRGAPVLAANVKLTRPLPLPVAPEEIVIQGVLVVAVQPQPAAAATSMPAVPPAAVGVNISGVTVKVQGAPWFTVNVRPAIVTVPERPAPVFAAIVSCTVPPPLPFAPDVTVTHVTFDIAVQLHPDPAVTDTVADPPDAFTVCCSGAMAKEQAVP